MSEERAHHPFSPSTLGLRDRCPKFTSRSTSTKAAEDGTRQHNAVELETDDNELGDDQAFAVSDCIEFCARLRKSKYNDAPGHDIKEGYWPIDKKKIVIRELVPGVKKPKVKLHKFEGTTAGYADQVFVSKCGTFADVVDWKFGMYEVTDAEFNLQGISYLLGVVRNYPKVERITVHFIAPHRDEHTFHTFTRDQFKELYFRVSTVVAQSVEAAKDPKDFSMATPDNSACGFCALLGKCPKANAEMIKLGRKLDPLTIPAETTPELLNDPKDVGLGLKLVNVVKAWADSFRTAATDKVVRELDFLPEGYQLVPQSRRKILSVEDVKKVAKQFGVTQETIVAASDISLTPLEKAVSALAKRGEKKGAIEDFSAALLEKGAVEEGATFYVLRQKKGLKTTETE